ncbi:hypothetical protein F2Q69_00057899 [Brassica cretica]|uniref:Uncharacterized protein n=1 Tax=Brassica cretica TaxID=69181 RepID=A0A8S9N6G4_BRACR|nr:hypothetical protein F2Q69_00057899 [Brassica cretica]
MSVSELKERHAVATETVNSLRDKLRQRRLQLLDTDVAKYSAAQGRSPVKFGATDLVCCRTLLGHTGKVRVESSILSLSYSISFYPQSLLLYRVYSLDWTPERNRIVSASQDGRLIVWNALTSQKTHAIKLPCAWVMTCAFSPNGQTVACGGLDSVCSIFSLSSTADKDGTGSAGKEQKQLKLRNEVVERIVGSTFIMPTVNRRLTLRSLLLSLRTRQQQHQKPVLTTSPFAPHVIPSNSLSPGSISLPLSQS